MAVVQVGTSTLLACSSIGAVLWRPYHPSKQTSVRFDDGSAQLHTVGLIVLDFARFPNGCRLDFCNGAKESISFDFSIFSAKLTKAALPLFSAVSTSSLMLSVLSLPMQC